jgi:hypothetical protein
MNNYEPSSMIAEEEFFSGGGTVNNLHTPYPNFLSALNYSRTESVTAQS